MRKMFAKKKKNKLRRSVYFMDELIKDLSIAHCCCQLYFLKPNFNLDKYGAVKEVFSSGDLELLSMKQCTVHLCVVRNGVDETNFTLEGTAQSNELCMWVKLNSLQEGLITYTIKDHYLHECRQKASRFLLHYDDNDDDFAEFEQKLVSTLQQSKDPKTKDLYLLVAVQTASEKRHSHLSQGPGRAISTRDLFAELASDRPRSSPSPNIEDTSDKKATGKDKCANDDNAVNFGEERSSGTFGDSGPKVVHSGKEVELDVIISAPFDDLLPFSPTDDPIKNDSSNEVFNDPTCKSVDEQTIDKLCDSLHIHPKELPERLQSILKSIDKSIDSGDTSVELQPRKNIFDNTYIDLSKFSAKKEEDDNNNDKSMDKTYMSMRSIKREPEREMTMDEDAKKLKKGQDIAKLLQAAILDRDEKLAEDYARLLCRERVAVTVDVKLNLPDEKEKEFDLKLFVEDREATKDVSITLKVKASDTIGDLKLKMLVKHGFPTEVQNWIIGKRIRLDNETLGSCKVKAPGCEAYLYIVSAESRGLKKEEYFNRDRPQGPMGAGGAMAQPVGAILPPMGAVAQLVGAVGRPVGPIAPVGGVGRIVAAMDPGVNQKPVIKKETVPPSQRPEAVMGDKMNFPKVNLNLKEDKKNVEKLPSPLQQGRVEAKVHARVQQSSDEIRHVLGQVAYQMNNMNIDEPRGRQPVEDEEPVQGWSCTACTFINQPTRPGCELCSAPRPADYVIPADYVMTEAERLRQDEEELLEQQTRQAQERERQAHLAEQMQNFQHLREMDTNENLISNNEVFTCAICFEDIDVRDGVVLRECLHSFCRNCLADAVLYNEEPVLRCPYQDERFSCPGVLQDREVKGLVSPEQYAKYLARSLTTAESQADNSFHCKTTDCAGWCIYEDLVNFFVCPVCTKENCLTCKAIHTGMNCRQYQDDLKARSSNDQAANQTQIMIRKMLDDGEAMNCPKCKVIVMKKEGCDWIQCSICKTEICWVTKQARWGPLGNGDISGGCRCRVNGILCHLMCNNCH
ncbi:hypothetical protein DPMN_174293 [Dreissena polymorpha]|uniref:RanBP-type and C3HC4-type zinc finger-containing protein 1 n=3 Tax=Dreissena polymorpha TaxID=45954 RepID=A0A9D4E611_DREPO|nr:hypothetical protein DPMN_174293 [Dreissena polymorpha]